MKSFISGRFAVMALTCLLVAGPSMAHDEHCHIKGADGKLSDNKDLKSKKACEEKGGLWQHHHAHCHKSDSPHVDIKEAKDEKACAAKGGKWTDHGHQLAE